MKNIFTLLVGGLLTTSAFANNITVNFSGKRNYQVMIDGRNVTAYNYSGGNTIYLNNLCMGRHTIEVYKLKRNPWFGSHKKLICSSYFTISPQNDLDIQINNRGNVQFYESRNGDFRRNNGWRNNGGFGNWEKRKHDGNDDNNKDDNNGYDNGGWNNNGYNQAMNDYDFNQLVQKIQNQWLGKFGTAKNAVTNNYFTTYQVRQLLQIFRSENDKLELAKLAYKNTVDQQNFSQLYDLFSYQAQSELDSYIRYNR